VSTDHSERAEAAALGPRVAVIGTGALGKEHARIYRELASEGAVRFSGVYDLDPDAARRVADRLETTAFASLEAACASGDAFSVVTPTQTHFSLVQMLLEQGKHVLVEKPITPLAEQAAALVTLASARGCLLMVGHVERFNPVYQFMQNAACEPRFIEVHRLSPFPARSTDIGVVLDLMIHDLDVVLAFVQSPVASLDAVGVRVLSATEDIANARIRFANSCVANLTASRISPERLRKIRVFAAGPPPSYVSLDYYAQEGYVYRLAREGEQPSSLLKKLLHAKDSAVVSEFAGRRIVREPVPLQKDEPLKLELRHFAEAVRVSRTPLVSGESARLALELALEITRQVERAQPPGDLWMP